MKGKIALVVVTLIATLISSPQAFSSNKTSVVIKKAGRSATSIPNTILSGNGIPTKTNGIDGDFYIDIKNANLYGPKTKGVWKLATSLRIPALPAIDGAVGTKGNTGEQGATGAAGTNGAAGSIGLPGANGVNGAPGAPGAIGATGITGATGSNGLKGDTGNVGATGARGEAGIAGTKGDIGATGNTGSSGAKGDTGLAGSNGADGTNGTNGAVGAAGIAGTAGTNGTNGTNGLKGDTGATGPDGIQGIQGDAGVVGGQGIQGIQGSGGNPGVDGTNGSQGIQGIQGIKGDTGNAGISKSSFVEIGQTFVSTADVGGATSWTPVASIDSGGSYTFEIIYDGVFSIDTFETKIRLGLTLGATSSTTTFIYRVFASDSVAYLDLSGGRHYQFLVIGVIVTATSNGLRLKIIDQLGLTGGVIISFTGNALINKVGSIG